MKTPFILLAEDSDDDAFFFEWVLKRSNVSCSLHRVVNGVEAVEFLGNASKTGELPQTIFLDLKMPLLNGFDVLDWMRTQTFAVPIQVIVLSGSEQEDDKQRAAQLGAADYLVKPIRVSHLHRILEHVCPPQTGVAS